VHELLLEHHIVEEICTPFIKILERAAEARFAPIPAGSARTDQEVIKELLAAVESGWSK
jgi:hypothetical protein